MSIEKTLKQRQKTHGDFNSHAEISQQLKGTLENFNYKELLQNEH